MRWPAGCAVAFALVLGIQAGGAAALPLAPNTSFTLGNHPDGSAAEPFYGLRLDALAGCDDDRDCGDDRGEHGDWKDDDDRDDDWKGKGSKHRGDWKDGDRDDDGDRHGDKDHGDDDDDRDLGAFVFDFGYCDPLAEGCKVTSEAVLNGAAMYMDTLPDGGLHIYGKAWGGLVEDHEFEDALLWAIDFRYTALAFDPDKGIQFAEEGSGSGTLTALQTRGGFHSGEAFALADEDFKQDISFALAVGARGFSGLSGFGELDPDDLANCEDGKRGKNEWLFTASNPIAVPEPGTLALSALGLLGLALRGRRRRRDA